MGNEFLTKKEFETWKNNFKSSLNLTMIKGEISKRFQNTDDLIQRGGGNYGGAGGTAVVFAEEFDVVPDVVISCEVKNYIAAAESITVNGFTAYLNKHDGTVGTRQCSWHAIGRKA